MAGVDTISYSIEVHIPPNIELDGTTHAAQVTIEGESVVFRCPATGLPEPLITWAFNGLPLNLASSHVTMQQGGRSLIVNSVKRTDMGEYVCRAQNAAGIDTANFDLAVYVPPKIKTGAPTQTIFKGA